MTRFDADTPGDRRKLFVEAITAHRERASAFVTFEAQRDAAAEGERTESEGGETEDGPDSDATSRAPPWVQFGDAVPSDPGAEDGGTERSGSVLNLDCTDEELESLKSLLGEFPAFKIDDITRPEEAEGVNVRVSALADPNRVAQCVERVFRDVYGQPEDYRVWVTAI